MHLQPVLGCLITQRDLAVLANIPLLLPSAMAFRRHHLGHHRNLGMEGLDNDLPTRWEMHWVGNSWWRKLMWWISYPLVGVFLRGFIRRPDVWEKRNIVVQILATALLAWFTGGQGILYLGLSTLFGIGIHPVAAHWIHEHYLFNRNQETYSYYGPLNWVTFNVGYHHEHHDLMNIPCWKLPKVRETAHEFYEGLQSHRSWIAIIWRFMTDERLGHFARMTRDSDASRAAT